MSLRILSWNVRKAVGLDWRRDPHRVCAVLAEQRADICLLQEVDKRLGDRPAAVPAPLLREIGLSPVDADPDTPSLGWHGNTILIRDGIALAGMHRIALPGLEPRGAVLAELRLGDRPLSVISAHLGLRRRDRRAQLAVLLHRLGGCNGIPILGGDLNEWKARPQALHLPPAWRMIVPGPSFHAEAPRLALDRFIIARDRPVGGAHVIDRAQARRASDHLPVVMDLPDVDGV